jgi:beta-1,4-mannosyltransferase
MTGGAALLDGIRAIRFLEAGGQPDPVLVLYHPPSPYNPFQRLLYAEGWSRGVAAVPLVDLGDAEAIAGVARGRVTLVLHLHWLAPATDRAADRAQSAAQAAAFLATLDRLMERGCRIAWTVHNVLPHDVRFEEEAVLARRGVVERAVMIHALNASTPEAAAPWFDIPGERLVVIPHPSYEGVYPESSGRDAARFELGLWPDEMVALAFGALRPYKGIPDLLAAWRAAATTPPTPRRLVVAGNPARRQGMDELVTQLAVAPEVAVFPRRIEVDEVAGFFRAADVAVLAHRDVLNSGALLLALTFGLPIVAPRVPTTAGILDPQVARLFEPGDVDSMAAALAAAPELLGGAARARALEIAAQHDPVEISRRFVEELRRRVVDA